MGAGIVNMFYPVVPGKLVPQVVLAASLPIIHWINNIHIFQAINTLSSIHWNKLISIYHLQRFVDMAQQYTDSLSKLSSGYTLLH